MSVRYSGKIVSDQAIKTVLERIASELKGIVDVTSGDRDFVPAGGSQGSLHLSKRAADFCVSGYTLANAFGRVKAMKDKIFDSDKQYEVIHHGQYTVTPGPHLHVGRYATGSGVAFKTEGLTPDSKGKYRVCP